ncbi:NADH-quinone oxidoreductase subunit NuoE [Fulvivirgaceae bacterium PWU5]|uniref:NADH-quinone oxidoreductase subunit NuoE n=1 Tax=Dawidia cretensis TaxID=2782350 RepID=A0AAP2GRD5_9BACT|nr:NADH-quinone oxidoreductase subunit NuoE [Dawidia cretensis]MBT1710249.1 NADH-quinone oxidoreductase subunit NuoE [Dawidia cretensis]
MSKVEFSPDTLALAQRIIKRYPEGRQKSALLPLLHVAQAEFDGWLSPETMDYVASLLNIKPIEVYEVASFYTMYNMKPVGKCLIEVCRTGPCWLRGADDIVEHFEKKLGVKEGETTADGMFTLKTVECLGSCGTAPMLQCGSDYYENLTTEKVDTLIEKLRASDNRSTYMKSNMQEL